MAKKSLGYVKLEWTCPNCQTRNPGPQKTCISCGMPQPEDVQFEQPAQEKLITDEAELEKAKAGPDIHCHYCGTRNPAGAKACSQCGADLTEGKARASGQVLGAHRSGPAEQVKCPACGTLNPPDAPKCKQCGASLAAPRPKAAARPTPAKKSRFSTRTIILVALLLCVIGGCITMAVLSSRTEAMTGTVESVAWTRNISIEELRPVEHEEWEADIPAEAIVGTCTSKVHHTQDDPTPGAKEVCGTPYTVDEGSGYGEVVQDCQYEVYAQWCKYTVEEWQEVDKATLSGSDFNPRWPQPSLAAGQREKAREEIYKVTFSTEKGEYVYTTSNEALFKQAEPGSRWLLEINTFGRVTNIEPAG